VLETLPARECGLVGEELQPPAWWAAVSLSGNRRRKWRKSTGTARKKPIDLFVED